MRVICLYCLWWREIRPIIENQLYPRNTIFNLFVRYAWIKLFSLTTTKYITILCTLLNFLFTYLTTHTDHIKVNKTFFQPQFKYKIIVVTFCSKKILFFDDYILDRVFKIANIKIMDKNIYYFPLLYIELLLDVSQSGLKS